MAEFPADLISTVLAQYYGLDLARLAPVKPGEMARAYQAVAKDGGRWFVKVRPDNPCWPLPKQQLDAALLLTLEMRESVKHADVVVPLLSIDGGPSVAAGGYLISVYPFLDLQPLGLRAMWPDDVLKTVASAVAEIQAAPVRGRAPFVEDFELWHQKALPDVIAGIQRLGDDSRRGQMKGKTVLAGMAD